MNRTGSKYIEVMADDTGTPLTRYGPYMSLEGVENASEEDEMGRGY